MNSLANWMQTTWINGLALNYAWTWPILETLHFIGLWLLFDGALGLRWVALAATGAVGSNRICW